MSGTIPASSSNGTGTLRCAIYTRKSTGEGLEQERHGAERALRIEDVLERMGTFLGAGAGGSIRGGRRRS